MERDDLGSLFAQVTRRLVDAERPLLAAHGLTMWEYIALSRLHAQPAGTQAELAQTMHYDKTRLIALLDKLEADRLLTREPDPVDRRARIVRLTAAGEARYAAARADIRVMENEMLGGLSSSERTSLIELVVRLAADS